MAKGLGKKGEKARDKNGNIIPTYGKGKDGPAPASFRLSYCLIFLCGRYVYVKLSLWKSDSVSEDWDFRALLSYEVHVSFAWCHLTYNVITLSSLTF